MFLYCRVTSSRQNGTIRDTVGQMGLWAVCRRTPAGLAGGGDDGGKLFPFEVCEIHAGRVLEELAEMG